MSRLGNRPGVYWLEGCFGQLHVSASISAGKQIRRVLDSRLVWTASCLETVERRNISLTPSKVSNPEYTGRPART